MSQQERLDQLSARYLDLFSMAMAIVRDGDDARDALQDALTATLVALHVRNPYAYCRRTLRNNCIDILRRRKRLAPIADIEVLTDEHYRDTADLAWQLKDELPDTLRALMEMHDVEGYTIAELAALTGTSAATVKRNIARAHAEMRKKLKHKSES